MPQRVHAVFAGTTPAHVNAGALIWRLTLSRCRIPGCRGEEEVDAYRKGAVDGVPRWFPSGRGRSTTASPNTSPALCAVPKGGSAPGSRLRALDGTH